MNSLVYVEHYSCSVEELLVIITRESMHYNRCLCLMVILCMMSYGEKNLHFLKNVGFREIIRYSNCYTALQILTRPQIMHLKGISLNDVIFSCFMEDKKKTSYRRWVWGCYLRPQ